MSRWRPTALSALYVVAPLEGHLHCLNRILQRILPLRRSDGGADNLIILGNFLGKDPSCRQLIDRLIEIQQYDRVHILQGEVERLLIERNQQFLLRGGYQIAHQYRKDIEIDELISFDSNRIFDLINKKHIEFISSLPSEIEVDDYTFTTQQTKGDGFNIYGGNRLSKPQLNLSGLNLSAGREDQVVVAEIHSLKAFIATEQQNRLEEIEIVGLDRI